MQRGEPLDNVENHPDQREEEHIENGNDHPHEYSEINVEDVVCRTRPDSVGKRSLRQFEK